MNKQRSLRSFIAWTMVAFMLPWSSFVYGGNYKAEAVTVTDERTEILSIVLRTFDFALPLSCRQLLNL